MMVYSLRLSTNPAIPKSQSFQVIPKWVINRMPKNQKCAVNYDNGVWRLNGKIINQFDKKPVAKAMESFRAWQGGAE